MRKLVKNNLPSDVGAGAKTDENYIWAYDGQEEIRKFWNDYYDVDDVPEKSSWIVCSIITMPNWGVYACQKLLTVKQKFQWFYQLITDDVNWFHKNLKWVSKT